MDSAMRRRLDALMKEKRKPKASPLGNLEFPELPIRRYLSLGKFYQLLLSRTLFMPRLSAMSDRSEGMIDGEGSDAFMHALMEKAGYPKETIAKELDGRRKQRELWAKQKDYCFVSSWTHDDDESLALWKIYVPGGEGISIETTVGDLCNSIEDPIRDHLSQGLVAYSSTGSNASNDVFFRKRRAYRYENEFRLFLNLLDIKEDGIQLETVDRIAQSGGLKLGLRNLTFIKKVHVSPFGGLSLRNLIPDMLKQFELSVDVGTSEIDEV